MVTTALIIGGASILGSVGGSLLSGGGGSKGGLSKSMKNQIIERNKMADYQYGQAQRSLYNAGQQIERSEEDLGYIENMLGSDEQLSNNMSNAEKMAPYLGYYDPIDYLNEYADSTMRPGQLKNADLSQTAYNERTKDANLLMKKAADAANAGDFEAADAFKAQAQGMWTDEKPVVQEYRDKLQSQIDRYEELLQINPNMKNSKIRKFQAAIAGLEDQLSDLDGVIDIVGKPGSDKAVYIDGRGRELNDSAQKRIDALKNPMGQTVGQIVKKGREFAEKGESYDELRGSLLDPIKESAEKSRQLASTNIADAERAAKGQLRDTMASRGAGRAVMAEAAAKGALARSAGAQRAEMNRQTEMYMGQVTSQINGWMEQYTSAYSANAVSMGRAYAQGSPGIRSEYLANMNALAAAMAGFSSQMAQGNQQLAAGFAANAAQLEVAQMEAQSAKSGKMAGGVSGTISGLVSNPEFLKMFTGA